MPLTGNFSKFSGLEAQLAKLASVPSRAVPVVVQKLDEELRGEFDSGTDPYGKAWAALKPATLATGRTPPPLTATGKLRDGTHAVGIQGSGVQLLAGAGYGIFHQMGTKNMAKRPIFPYGGMPIRWTQIIKNAIKLAYQR